MTSSSSSSASSTTSEPCGPDACGWVFDTVVFQDWVPADGEAGCEPGHICDKPVVQGHPGLECTPCLPIESSSSSSAAALHGDFGGGESGSSLRVIATYPSLTVAGRIVRKSTIVPVGGSNRIIDPSAGWLVCFRHHVDPNLNTGVALQPHVAAPGISDQGYAAAASVSEQGGMQEYWVTVIGTQPWAQLVTKEWDILFVKLRS